MMKFSRDSLDAFLLNEVGVPDALHHLGLDHLLLRHGCSGYYEKRTPGTTVAVLSFPPNDLTTLVYVVNKSYEEALKCDLMLICGTSAVVYPFADLPRVARRRGNVVIIEVNAEPTPPTMSGISNYIMEGKTGESLPKIVERVKRLKSQ